MKTDIAELLSVENSIAERQVWIDFKSFQSKLGDFPILRKEPFLLNFENFDNKSLHISGETDVSLAIPCDRCLEEVSVPIHLVIDRKYPIAGEGAEENGEEDTAYVTEGSLDVDCLVYHEILVNLPRKVLCREDCKGICKKCGANRNNQTCSCSQEELDPRMAAFRDVFQQFKEV